MAIGIGPVAGYYYLTGPAEGKTIRDGKSGFCTRCWRKETDQMDRVNRRRFLRNSVGAAAGASALVAARRVPARTAWPNETVIV
ncbi:hypothetical protein AMJ85_00765, partial [candidate division BRC1 bacterium SM23_51]